MAYGTRERAGRPVSRRQALKGAGALVAAAWLLGFSGCAKASGAAADPQKIVVGANKSTAQTVIGDQKGFFADELKKLGKTVEFKAFTSGMLAVEALKAGDIAFACAASQPVVTSRANGTDIRFFTSYKITSKGNALVVPEGGAKTVAELKGKKIGYTAGTTLNNLVLKILKEAGLSQDDVHLVNMQVTETVTSLQSGNIDGGLLWEPLITTLTDKGGFRVLRDGDGLLREYGGFIATDQYLKDHADVAEAFVRGLKTSNDWVNAHPDETAQIVAKASDNTVNAVKTMFAKSDQRLTITDNDLASIKDTADFLKQTGTVKKLVDPSDVVTRDVLKRAGIEG